MRFFWYSVAYPANVFSNAVELIVAIIALLKGEIVLVQTFLVGSTISNLLLILGMCFLFGGQQYFNDTAVQTSMSLLALAATSVTIPTVFGRSNTHPARNAALSRGTAVVLLVVYSGYLYFQLRARPIKFNKESKKAAIHPCKAGARVGVGCALPEDEDELVSVDTQIGIPSETFDEPHLHIAVAWATLAGAAGVMGMCAGMYPISLPTSSHLA